MRCENCQADVAAQVAQDGSIICGKCGEVLEAIDDPQFEAQLRQAKELLERWSKEPLLEPLEPLPGKEASHLSEVEKFQARSESEPENETSDTHPELEMPAEIKSESDVGSEPGDEDDLEEPLSDSEGPSPGASFEIELHEVDTPLKEPLPEPVKPRFRFDAAHVSQETGSDTTNEPAETNGVSKSEADDSQQFDFDALDAETAEANNNAADSKGITPEPAVPEPAETAATEPQPVTAVAFQSQRVDSAQAFAAHSPPHLDIQQLIDQRLQEEKQGFNWMVFAGQWLSYLGVLGLTAGAALIVYGYFGGTAEMVPKGWMLTTAGQMLLLLGIVTLISGGLDQANSEVNTRIQVLGEQMLRFERETKQHFLRGPKISAGQYAENAKPPAPKQTADKPAES